MPRLGAWTLGAKGATGGVGRVANKGGGISVLRDEGGSPALELLLESTFRRLRFDAVATGSTRARLVRSGWELALEAIVVSVSYVFM